MCLAKPNCCHGSLLVKHEELWLVATRYTWLDVGHYGWWVICTEDFSLFQISSFKNSSYLSQRKLQFPPGSWVTRQMSLPISLIRIPSNVLFFFVFTGTLKRSRIWLERCRGSKTLRRCWTQRMHPWLRLWERSVTSTWKTGTWRRSLPK